MELAAAGISIALFNQASRITIFPLVSITTSFVAEEDTVGRVGIKEAEKGSDKHNETTDQCTPEDAMLEDMERGEAGKKGQNLEKSLPKDSEMKEFMPGDVKLDLEKDDPKQNVENAESSSAKKSQVKIRESMQENSTLEDVDRRSATTSDEGKKNPDQYGTNDLYLLSRHDIV